MAERTRRRAVGPAGAAPARAEPRPRADELTYDGAVAAGRAAEESDDDERLLADRPPHHDREP